MNKIRFKADQDANYVFHMLSVARCGYDNAYGEKFRDLYSPEDMEFIKSNEELLTVCGGEHCGILYDLMVCQPAAAKVSAKKYYCDLINLGQLYKKEGNFVDIDSRLVPYIDTIISISEIMIKYYDEYIENIWKDQKQKIEDFISYVFKLFEESDFTEKAEKIVGCTLPDKYFIASFVTSVENGAEAINISNEQDIFGIERSSLDSFNFIGHEFIIYLLLSELKNENAFKGFDTWSLTEGLAEYYLKKINGEVFLDGFEQYVEFYEKCAEKGELSAVELYKTALKAYRM